MHNMYYGRQHPIYTENVHNAFGWKIKKQIFHGNEKS